MNMNFSLICVVVIYLNNKNKQTNNCKSQIWLNLVSHDEHMFRYMFIFIHFYLSIVYLSSSLCNKSKCRKIKLHLYQTLIHFVHNLCILMSFIATFIAINLQSKLGRIFGYGKTTNRLSCIFNLHLIMS